MHTTTNIFQNLCTIRVNDDRLDFIFLLFYIFGSRVRGYYDVIYHCHNRTW